MQGPGVVPLDNPFYCRRSKVESLELRSPKCEISRVTGRSKLRNIFLIALFVSGFTYLSVDSICLFALDLWVSTIPHADLQLIAYDSNGKPITPEQFFRTWRPALFVRDRDGCSALGIQHGFRKILIAIPPDRAVSVEVLWSVPGFGKLLLSADNRGFGYVASKDRTPVIELVLELARSRIDQVRRWIESHREGAALTVETGPDFEVAKALLRRAEIEREPGARTLLSLESLRHSLKSSEDEVLREARASISAHRRGRLRLTVTDRAGEPIKQAKITVEQRRFDFHFGVHHDGYDTESLNRLKAAFINDGVLYLDWKEIEPQPGRFQFAELDTAYPASLVRQGFQLRGHALVWLASGELPSYMTDVRGEASAVNEHVKNHVAHVVEHFRDRVQIWEANNEGHAAWAKLGLNEQEIDQIVKTSAMTIRRLAPESEILINLSLPLGEDLSLKRYPLIRQLTNGRISSSSSDPFRFIERLSREGVPFDSIGLQFYNGACVELYGGIQVPAIDLFRFAQELERYSNLGKRVYITEIAAGSAGCTWPGQSWWHQARNQQTQSDYLEGVFAIAYGNPNVEGITWWDLYDDGAFVEGGGLFDSSGRAKAAYTRLSEILKAWRTDRTLETDSNGTALVEGDAGEYRIITRHDNVASILPVHLRAERSESAVVSLDERTTSSLASSRDTKLAPIHELQASPLSKVRHE